MRRTTLAALLALLPLAAACNGEEGVGTDVLTPAEVAGTYTVCELRFQPLQTALPAADLLQRVVETSPPPNRPGPSLTLSPDQPSYDLVYTRRGDNFLQQLRGSLGFGETEVFVRLYEGDDPPVVAREALLPGTLSLGFSDAPRTLVSDPNEVAYSVRRADYARAAGISEEGLQDRINGRLTARLVQGACQ